MGPTDLVSPLPLSFVVQRQVDLSAENCRNLGFCACWLGPVIAETYRARRVVRGYFRSSYYKWRCHCRPRWAIQGPRSKFVLAGLIVTDFSSKQISRNSYRGFERVDQQVERQTKLMYLLEPGGSWSSTHLRWRDVWEITRRERSSSCEWRDSR